MAKDWFGMDYKTSVLLGFGAIAISYWLYQMGGINKLKGLVGAKANYAYPNFYPYGHPFYYMHMDDPSVRNNYGFGQVNVPRISNALAAKFVEPANIQRSHSNPAYDNNHIYSYIQEEY